MRQIQNVRTPSGVLPLILPIAQKLLTEGVISGTLDGDLHAADAATVKAAIMASSICDFCSAPGATHHYDVPDGGMAELPNNYGAGKLQAERTGVGQAGWMACDVCDALIGDGKRRQLVDRAAQMMAFPKFSRSMIEQLYATFWKGIDDRANACATAQVVGEFVDDKLPACVHPVPQMSSRDKRVQAMVRVTGLTVAELEDAMRDAAAGRISRAAVAKLVAWRKQFGTTDPRTVADLLGGVGPRAPLPDLVPHWQRALDGKFAALGSLTTLLEADKRSVYFPEATDLNDMAAVKKIARQAEAVSALRDMGFMDDVKFLRAAAAYSFSGETIAAIRQAAQGVPHDAALSSIETPNTGAGWFWFAEPLPVTASPIVSDKVNALLWGWVNAPQERVVTLTDDVLQRLPVADLARINALATDGQVTVTKESLSEIGGILRRAGISADEFAGMSGPAMTQGEPAIMFSAYVVDYLGKYVAKGTPGPSTRWYWPLSLTFDEMLAFNREAHRRDYGKDGKYAQLPNLVGEEDTLKCVAELSLFFVMACLWFRQTVPGQPRKPKAPVLTLEDGHVERHARKRLAKDHGLDAPPTVQVVALRKSARVASEDAETPEQRASARHYGCRWIVAGHPRHQACGPGRKDRKLIWIEAHVAGPPEAPLKTREKVFAVVR